ncbi:MAG: hypothetical protein ACOC1G_07705, partial [Phycisphaeraceae bacterium]
TIHIDTASKADALASERPNRFAIRHDSTVFLGEMAQHRLTVGDGDTAQSVALKVFELNPRLFLTGSDTAHARVADEDVVILSD